MEPIAIVGLDCVFPGADGVGAFWRLLVEGREAVTRVPAQRWDAEAYFDADPRAVGKIASRWGGFVDLEGFDAEFFAIPRGEAERMDPQHKLLLEVSYRALENAGIPVKSLVGSATGVFAGVGHCDHELKLKRELTDIDENLGVHSYRCFAANRLSYHLNLHGPSVALDTACSSALSAVHLACQSLQCGECDLAIAGGVNAHLLPEESVSSTKMGLLSPDGRCRSFAADAQGHARSEGCGVVILKRLRDALEQRDTIWAVIRGSALNHNGASNGITAPQGAAQVRVIRRALERAGVEAHAVDYVEAHATGTTLGDRIELAALHELLAANRTAARPCHVGCVKPNLGHLEAAAGIAGLIKTVLALRHEQIPRSLYAEQPHPDLPLGDGLALVTQPVPWPRRPGEARVAGVSAFGFGGANAHLVLEEAPPSAPHAGPRRALPLELLLLSARTERDLAQLELRTKEALAELAAPALADFCATLRSGRSALPLRRALVGADATTLRSQLDAAGAAELCRGRAARVVQVAYEFGASARVARGAIERLRSHWPELASRALSSAERYAAQLPTQQEREAVMMQCALVECLLAWKVVPSALCVLDPGGGHGAAYAKQRVLGGAWQGPLSVGIHELKGERHRPLTELAAESGRRYRLVALGRAVGSGETSERPSLAPFDGDGLWPSLLRALGQLWVEGVNVDWGAFDREQQRSRTLVPNYPFDRQPSWYSRGVSP